MECKCSATNISTGQAEECGCMSCATSRARTWDTVERRLRTALLSASKPPADPFQSPVRPEVSWPGAGPGGFRATMAGTPARRRRRDQLRNIAAERGDDSPAPAIVPGRGQSEANLSRALERLEGRRPPLAPDVGGLRRGGAVSFCGACSGIQIRVVVGGGMSGQWRGWEGGAGQAAVDGDEHSESHRAHGAEACRR